MPYKDPEKRKQASKESMKKKRGINPDVNPLLTPVNPDVNPCPHCGLYPNTEETTPMDVTPLMIEATNKELENRGIPPIRKGMPKGGELSFSKTRQARGFNR
jgi:hypothetical protein